MRPLLAVSVAVLVALLGLVLVTWLPARGPWSWMLRVGVPEYGALFALLALPALVVLSRDHPVPALALGVGFTVAFLGPLARAARVARGLPAELAGSFPGAGLPRSPLARGALRPVTVDTEEYAPGLAWDRYRPEGAPWVRVLFVHGGSWARGERGDYPALMRELAGRGVELHSASYRLAPAHPFPAARDDVAAALRVLAARPGPPVVLVGRSAGGHLCHLVAHAAPELAAGVVSFYAPADMRWSWDHPSHPDVLDTPTTLGDFLGGPPDEVGEVYDRASPARTVHPGAPPTLLIHGARDSMVSPEQGRILARALAAAGVDHHLLLLPWLEHGGDVLPGGPSARIGAWAIEAFLRWCVRDAA